jgi:hypothetical protein
MACLFDRIINILDGRLKSEALRLSLTRRETFDRYAAQHDAKMMTRFERARCQMVAKVCGGPCAHRNESDSLNHSTPDRRLAR